MKPPSRKGSRKEADQIGVTWSTYVDLGKPAGVTVFHGDTFGSDDLYVCAPYVMGQVLIKSDNVLGICTECRKPIQMRPHAPPKLRKICTPCVLAQGLRIPAF